jgi:Protein of unknown function (DUF4019)
MAGRIIFIVSLMLVLSAAVVAGESGKEKAALTAAMKWLAIVDRGRYCESWQRASEFFRNAVPQEQWEQSLRAVRKPLGRLISRKLTGKVYTTSLPGAPDGEYIVIQFASSFENKKSAVETATPALDKDGVWRVSGYYIK